MKVLFLDQTAELGGGELSLLSEVTHLPHECSVLLFESGPLCELLANAGVAVEVISNPFGAIAIRRGSGLLASLMAIPVVLSLVFLVASRARKHDIIYANSQKAFVVGAFAAAVSRRPLVWHLHDILDAAHFSSLMRRAAIVLANWKAKRVIVNSRATGAAFTKLGGDATRVSLAYQGLDDAPFDVVPLDEIAAIRAELNAGTHRLIGVFGRLSAWKGQAIFIDAIARLPDVIGVIVGGALFGEEAYAAELSRKVETLGLGSRIRFLGFRNDIPALMRSMDIIVHSSIAPEPFGRVVVEGMLAGKPVIASAAGGVLEIIENGKTGWLVEPGNAEALAETLRTVLENPIESTKIAVAGQAHARANFTITAKVKQIDEALMLC